MHSGNFEGCTAYDVLTRVNRLTVESSKKEIDKLSFDKSPQANETVRTTHNHWHMIAAMLDPVNPIDVWDYPERDKNHAFKRYLPLCSFADHMARNNSKYYENAESIGGNSWQTASSYPQFAYFFDELFDKLGVDKSKVAEIGAGDGNLALNLSKHCGQHITTFNYSDTLRQKQLPHREHFTAKSMGDLTKDNPFPAEERGQYSCVVLNEVPDDLPHYEVRFANGKAFVLFTTIEEGDGYLVPLTNLPPSHELHGYLKKHRETLPRNGVTYCSPATERALDAARDLLTDDGFIIITDYGYTTETAREKEGQLLRNFPIELDSDAGKQCLYEMKLMAVENRPFSGLTNSTFEVNFDRIKIDHCKRRGKLAPLRRHYEALEGAGTAFQNKKAEAKRTVSCWQDMTDYVDLCIAPHLRADAKKRLEGQPICAATLDNTLGYLDQFHEKHFSAHLDNLTVAIYQRQPIIAQNIHNDRDAVVLAPVST